MNICSWCSRKNRIYIIESFLNIVTLFPKANRVMQIWDFNSYFTITQTLFVITFLSLPLHLHIRMKHHVHAMFNKTHSVRFILVSSCNNDDAQICNGKNWMKELNAQIQLCNKQGFLHYNTMFWINSLLLIFEFRHLNLY